MENEITDEIDLYIIKIITFETNLINAIYSDNTSIVVHPSFEYFTYFHYDNKKYDMKSEFLIKQFAIDSKMNLLVSVYNLFSDDICPYTEKYVNEYGLNCDVVKIDNKAGYAYWIDDEKFYEETDEYYLLNSTDSNTKLYLFRNLRVIKVEYLIPNTEGEFQYIKICKFFSINNIKNFWFTPLILLVNHYNLKPITNNFELLYWDSRKERIVNKEYRTSLPVHNRNKRPYKCNICNITLNPIAFCYDKDLPIKFIYTRNYTYIVDNKCKEIDIVNNEYPSMNIYTKSKCELLIYQSNPEDLSSAKNLHIDTYAKVMNEIGEYTCLNYSEKEGTDPSNEIANEIINIKRYGNMNYYDQMNSSTEPSMNDFKTVSTQQSHRSLSNRNSNKTLKREFVFEGGELELFREIKGVGEFFSYTSKSVKANFEDRTVARMNGDQQLIDILDKRGIKHLLVLSEVRSDNVFFPYIKMLVEFYDTCFNKDNIRKSRENKRVLDFYMQRALQRIADSEEVVFKKKNISYFLYLRQNAEFALRSIKYIKDGFKECIEMCYLSMKIFF